MDINTFTQLVGQIGFPIVAFLLMYKMNSETIGKMTSVIADNTAALNRILSYIEAVDKHKEE